MNNLKRRKMSDVAEKTENNAESVVNGTADDKVAKQVANIEIESDEKKQKKKKPNNKSKCG